MDNIFIKNLPYLDIHGYDRDSARVAINDFIKDNVHMKRQKILIIHGKGEGILKTVTRVTLQKNKNVKDFKISYFNDGCTVVELEFDKV